MLMIKLKRIGKKHQAAFRVVVTEKRSKLDGACVEDIGFTNPSGDKVLVAAERAKFWMERGAKLTPTVHNILVREGIIQETKMPVHRKKKVGVKSK